MKRGKNGNAEETRRALEYKEDGQGELAGYWDATGH